MTELAEDRGGNEFTDDPETREAVDSIRSSIKLWIKADNEDAKDFAVGIGDEEVPHPSKNAHFDVRGGFLTFGDYPADDIHTRSMRGIEGEPITTISLLHPIPPDIESSGDLRQLTTYFTLSQPDSPNPGVTASVEYSFQQFGADGKREEPLSSRPLTPAELKDLAKVAANPHQNMPIMRRLAPLPYPRVGK